MDSSQHEKLRAALAVGFDKFIAALAAFEENEVNTLRERGRWTPAQVAWHIILATDGLPDERTRPSDRTADALLAGIRLWWDDLNQKFISPEPLRPDDKPREKQFLLAELARVKEKDLNILTAKDLTAICLDFELPHTGYLTRLEWLWFIEMHLKRHTFQLEKMKIKSS
jgi:hypothetical protein